MSKGKEEMPVDLTNRLALRPKEAAKVLGVCERTLRAMLPQLPHLREGGAVLIPVDGLRDWLRKETELRKDRTDAAVKDVLDAVTQADGDEW